MEPMENQSWVEHDLKKLDVCFEAIKEARKYPDAQTAWDAWTSADELIWTLLKLRANPDQMILCCCELVEPVLEPMFHEINNATEKKNYLGAFNAVRDWATNPTRENFKRVDYFYDDVVGWTWPDRRPIAAYTGKAVEKLVLAVERPHKLLDLPDAVKSAVHYILRDGWMQPVVPGIANIDLTQSQYEKWQCDTVRRSFPITPFIKAYR